MPLTGAKPVIAPSRGYSCHQFTGGHDSGEGIVSQYRSELEQYKSQLRALRPAVGGVVMNCNPFTLGHRYLVEFAASRVERLYVFVVEEDKSVFPFADRIELAKKGTADLKNVTVLPSGKFIISSLTFSGYFNKAELQDSMVDPSMDVELFGTEIAPQLGITVRFAGEEPLDNVTQRYNETMARILPKYGIDFEVIPRKEMNGNVISASRVRKLLEENNFDEIQKLVPKTTLEYLNENYRKEFSSPSRFPESRERKIHSCGFLLNFFQRLRHRD